MGLFLSMSGIIGGSEESVAVALREYAETNKGSFEKATLTTDDDGCLVISKSDAGVTVLYPGDFFEWDSASQHLSQCLDKPIFSFHIHDGDLWMYVLYEKNEVIDQFNPVPEYWGELDEDERRSWQGNVAAVAKHFPGLAAEAISKYLVEWSDELLESNERLKAYPSDEFYYGDDWQIVDFMNKLGLQYPIDDQGVPRGATYRFKCESAHGR